MTLSGIEPATFRFVAQRLNHCATAVLSRSKTWEKFTSTNCCFSLVTNTVLLLGPTNPHQSNISCGPLLLASYILTCPFWKCCLPSFTFHFTINATWHSSPLCPLALMYLQPTTICPWIFCGIPLLLYHPILNAGVWHVPRSLHNTHPEFVLPASVLRSRRIFYDDPQTSCLPATCAPSFGSDTQELTREAPTGVAFVVWNFQYTQSNFLKSIPEECCACYKATPLPK